MSLRVIGTGQARTGTTSLKLALEHLGFGKCYHMYDLFNNPDQIVFFERAERGEDIHWDQLLECYQSTCDMPLIEYYGQLIQTNEDAMVIHTTRDAETWYESMKNTVFWAINPDPGRKFRIMIRFPFSSTIRKRSRVFKYNKRMMKRFFGEDLGNKAKVIDRYKTYNDQVLASIPKDKLLVYDIRSGWEPVCEFLQVPVPKIPFPKSNTTEEFLHNMKHNMMKPNLMKNPG